MANEGRDRVTGGQGILEWDEGYVIRLLIIDDRYRYEIFLMGQERLYWPVEALQLALHNCLCPASCPGPMIPQHFCLYTVFGQGGTHKLLRARRLRTSLLSSLSNGTSEIAERMTESLLLKS